jgi:hypothetical protein
LLTTRDIVFGVIYPALIALIVVPLAHVKRRGRRDTHAWGLPFALAAGFTVAFIGISGKLNLPPTQGQEWLVIGAAAAVVISIIAAISDRARVAVVISSIALLVLVMAWLVPANRRQWLTTREAMTMMIAIGAGLVVWWALMEPLAARYRGATLPLLLSAVAGAGAMVIADGGSQRLGLIEGAAAVALLVVALLALWLRELSLARGGVLTIAIVMLGLLVCGYLYADVKWPQVVILAVAPLLAWVGMVRMVRERRAWQRFVIVAVLVLIVVSIAAIPAARGLRKTMQEQTESHMF